MDVLLLQLGDTIQGESTLEGYAGQIEVLSFSHAISQPILHDLMGRAGGAGRPQHQDFTCSKYLDRSSTGIIDACDRATVIPQVTFTIGQAGSEGTVPLWVVTMKDVLVASVSFAGGPGDRPTESIALNYTAISWTYTRPADEAGHAVTESASWNLKTNTETV